MNGDKALRRLAGRVGIEARYTDALGQTREASNEALSALIAALGLGPEPVRAMAELDEQEAERLLGLGPVHLVSAEDPRPEIALRLPAPSTRVAWQCRLEDGDRRSGTVEPAFADGDGTALIPLPAGMPLGYHWLELEAGAVSTGLSLIVAPAQCHLPEALQPGRRSWGLTCQLYGQKSANNWGVGDFGDLAMLARTAGSCGAAVLGVNPLHALFAAEPLHISPYSPSSRNLIDYLYIDVTAVSGFAEDAAVRALVGSEWFGATHWAGRSAELIDYGAVAALKLPVLQALYDRFRSRELGPDGTATGADGKAFREFQRAGGRPLQDFATFEALHEHYRRTGATFSWRDWPAPMRDPRAATVAEFAAAHRHRVEFFQFLQWEADRQLAAAAAAGRGAGLSLGLYRDLAVGANPNGAEAWSDQALVAPEAAIGAPPDALSRRGQNWGLAPVNPLVLRQQGFMPFVAALRTNMCHAGVLRIDHVMSLNRLYWIPRGMEATEGAYVAYPFQELLRLVALESRRHGCAVVGEDLGTLPEGFRDGMRAAEILSYRVVFFERSADRGFVAPAGYPRLAAAAAATHDMPTIRGFWLGRDLAWRRRLGLYHDERAAEAEATERARDRRLLLEALAREGLIAVERFAEFLSASGEPSYSAELADAVLAYLARSEACLCLVQLEDVCGESEQANLPGTTAGHPNWRRRLAQTLEEIAEDPRLRRVGALLAEGRRRRRRGMSRPGVKK
jgi:4-alpha-glucanotransferase